MTETPLIIAIDGPAAAGKGTLARRLAQHFDLALLDTGLLYRAVGMKLARDGGDPGDEAAATEAARGLLEDDLAAHDLRSDEAANAASQVAVNPGVRAALLEFQRAYAHAARPGFKGCVLDGRDIGTVVLPDAPVKIFVTASVEVRATRRVKELQERGLDGIYARVLSDMQERDARDSSRAVAPLEPAADAWVLDTSDLDADQVFDAAVNHIHALERAAGT